MRSPRVRRRPSLGACIQPVLERLEWFQRVGHVYSPPLGTSRPGALTAGIGSWAAASGRASGRSSRSAAHCLSMVGWLIAQRVRYMAENSPNPPRFGVLRSLESDGTCESFDRLGADMSSSELGRAGLGGHFPAHTGSAEGRTAADF